MGMNGVGVGVRDLTYSEEGPPKIGHPGRLYDHMYGKTMETIMHSTNFDLEKRNAEIEDTRKKIRLFSLTEITRFFGMKLLISLDKGPRRSIEWYYKNVYLADKVIFDGIKVLGVELDSSALKTKISYVFFQRRRCLFGVLFTLDSTGN